VGLGWLAINARRSGSSASIQAYQPLRPAERVPRVGGRADLMGQPDGATSSNELGQPPSQGVVDTARNKASAVIDATQDAASRAAESAASMASTVATTVSETASTQSDRVAQSYRTNPLAMGAVVTALGLAAGFLIPSTQKEAELLGETRDDLMDRTRDVVREKKEQVQHVAQRVVTEAKSVATQAAREEGLTG
jgi:vacuolar-type H+-ATPase subunit H